MEIRPQKRIFIGLLVLTCLILFFFIFLLWYVPLVGLKNIHPSLPLPFSLALFVLVFLMISGGLLLVFTILRGKDILFSHKLRGIVAKVLFPLMILMGKLVGVSKEKVQQSFIELNNHLVQSNQHRTRPNQLLVLLPHCIQDFDCQIKITGNIKNCKGCGKCEIKDLIELSDQYQVKIAVVDDDGELRDSLLETVEEWVRDCLADRRLISP